jgi:hypothetical protein
MEWFYLEKLNQVEAKEQYEVKISIWFLTLESSDDDADLSKVWEIILKNITISTKESLGSCEMKKYNPWFNEAYSELLDQTKEG